MTLTITTLKIMSLNITTLSMITLSITKLRIITFSNYDTDHFGIWHNDTQYNKTQHNNTQKQLLETKLNIKINIICIKAQNKSRNFTTMFSNLACYDENIMLSVVKLSVVMLSVMAPFKDIIIFLDFSFEVFIYKLFLFFIFIETHKSIFKTNKIWLHLIQGNTKGGSITVPLTSCLTGLESAV